MFKKIVSSLILVICFFLLNEVILSLLGFGKAFKKNPCAISKYKEQLNSQGFRDDELKHNSTIDILCLGDSTTFGWGLNDRKLAYPNRLEIYLNKYFKEKGLDENVEVYNAGIRGSFVDEGSQVYHRLKDIKKWQYVIITFAWNDPAVTEWFEQSTPKNQPVQPFLHRIEKAMSNLKTFNFMKTIIRKTRYYNYDDSMYIEKAMSQQYYNDFSKLIKLIKSNGADVIVLPALIEPNNYETRMGFRVRCLNKIAKTIAEREKIAYLELNEEFHNNRKQIGWWDICHYDSYGHELIANALYNFLKNHIETDTELFEKMQKGTIEENLDAQLKRKFCKILYK